MSDIGVISLADAAPVPLAGGNWSKVPVSGHTAGGNSSAPGYSVFKPGEEGLVMIFSSSSPGYPPTERGEPTK